MEHVDALWAELLVAKKAYYAITTPEYSKRRSELSTQINDLESKVYAELTKNYRKVTV